MVYIGQSLESRKWGFQIIEHSNRIMRILDEDYPFMAITEALQFVEVLKSSTMKSVRDRDTNAYGYVLMHNNKVIKEEFGWSSPDEVMIFIADFQNAIKEGVKMKPDFLSKKI